MTGTDRRGLAALGPAAFGPVRRARLARHVRLASSALLGAALWAPAAHAGLFDDDEARKAILDLRQKLEQTNEQQRLRQADLNKQMLDQLDQIKRSLLDLNGQIDGVRADNAKLRGQNEQLAQDLAEVQRRQKDIQQGVDDRMRKLEPQKVTVDGREFAVDPEEKRAYDDAMETLRKGDFVAAASAYSAFEKRYPGSGYTPSVTFWLGNAYYGKREYKEAIASFRSLVASAPDSPRAPEALLSIANCQAELRDTKAARRTLDDLLKTYPKTEAAQAARDRLTTLR